MLAILAARAGAAPLPGFVLTAQTEHFSFYTRGEKVDAPKAERFLEHVAEILGQPLDGRAEYYRYGSPEELAAGTGTYASGVTYPWTHQIHSTEGFHAHEIVHLVAAQLGNPGTFFQEGLAVALGNESKWHGQDVHKIAKKLGRGITIDRLVTSFDHLDAETAYPLAGSFMAHLIKVHGIDKVAQFFRASGPRGTDTEAAFRQSLGMSYQQADQEWLAAL